VDAQMWQEERRPEMLSLLAEHVYGRTPTGPIETEYEITSEAHHALNGQATRKEITVRFRGAQAGATMNLLLYLPAARREPVPVFLGLNFYGNHTVHPDPGITIPTAWMRDDPALGVQDHRATEKGRGLRASRWPVE